MRCPFCQHPDTQVRDSRPTEEGAAIRRRRLCAACGGKFTTFERVQLRELMVVKRSTGKRAPFEREKLARSLKIALNKRPVSDDQIDQMVSGIVRQLESSGESEIPSSKIGEHVMDALAAVDPVGYVRYASVYKNFRAAEDFGRFVGDARIGREKEGDARDDPTALPPGRERD